MKGKKETLVDRVRSSPKAVKLFEDKMAEYLASVAAEEEVLREDVLQHFDVDSNSGSESDREREEPEGDVDE